MANLKPGDKDYISPEALVTRDPVMSASAKRAERYRNFKKKAPNVTAVPNKVVDPATLHAPHSKDKGVSASVQEEAKKMTEDKRGAPHGNQYAKGPHKKGGKKAEAIVDTTSNKIYKGFMINKTPIKKVPPLSGMFVGGLVAGGIALDLIARSKLNPKKSPGAPVVDGLVRPKAQAMEAARYHKEEVRLKKGSGREYAKATIELNKQEKLYKQSQKAEIKKIKGA